MKSVQKEKEKKKRIKRLARGETLKGRELSFFLERRAREFGVSARWAWESQSGGRRYQSRKQRF